MNLRHIEAFIAVAEELHFGRAAKRLHIEQSPLSRRIRLLEADLGAQLLNRDGHGVSLTDTGRIFLDDARRVMLMIKQARSRLNASTEGRHGTLHVGIAGEIGRKRLSALLALCRQESPGVSLQLTDLSLPQLLHGLQAGLLDAGIAMADDVGNEIVAMPLWTDPFLLAIPARHPLLAYKEIPLQEAVNYPLVLCNPDVCHGCHLQRERLLRSVNTQTMRAEYVNTHSLMLAFVEAGYGVGLSSAAHLEGQEPSDMVMRPLTDQNASLTTCLLRRAGEVSEPLRQFIDRAKRASRQSGGDLSSLDV